ALFYYHKSLRISRLQKNLGEEAHSLNCIANTHLNTGKLFLADRYSNMSLNIHNAVGDYTWLALDLSIKGEIAISTSQYVEGMAFLDEAIIQLKHNYDKRLLLGVYCRKALAFLKMGRYDQAMSDLKTGRSLLVGFQ